MKAYINIRIVIDPVKKSIKASTDTKVDNLSFKRKLSFSKSNSNNIEGDIFKTAYEPLKLYGDIFGA